MTTRPKRQTPWGLADQEETLAPGIVKVYTPSHGGIILDAAHVSKIPKSIQAGYSGTRTAWEEDCDWAVPLLLFETEIEPWYISNGAKPGEMRVIARATLEHYRPDWLAAIDAATAKGFEP